MLDVSIKKRLGKFTLDVAFTAGNDTIALLGASGCGKSYTLKCIAGIETPDEGRIVLDGRVLFDSEKNICLSPQERRVGYLFQQYALFPSMSVAQNIASGVRTKDKEARREIVQTKIKALHLEGLEDKRPAQLSGGQQQRVALARILVNEPELLLLDEPFSALDDYLKWQLELELSDTLAEYRKTAVFVSHNRNEVYRLCNSVCVLSEGRSEPRRSVKDLFKDPETFSAGLISGCKNFSKIRRTGAQNIVATNWGASLRTSVPVPDDARYIGVRAHYILPADRTDENAIPCRVNRVVEDVFSTVVMLEPPCMDADSSFIRMELEKGCWAGETGRDLYVKIRPADIMFLRE